MLSDLILAELGPECECPCGHDAVAGGKSAADDDAVAIEGRAKLDRDRAKLARLVAGDEDDLSAFEVLNGVLRDDSHCGAASKAVHPITNAARAGARRCKASSRAPNPTPTKLCASPEKRHSVHPAHASAAARGAPPAR